MISLDDLLAQDLQESRVWIDDHLLQDEGIIVLLSSKELAAPSVRNMSVAVPGRHGSYDFGGWLEPREFTLNLILPRQSYTDLKRQIRTLNTRFFDEYGRPKTVRLRFGDEQGVHYNVRVTEDIPVERSAKRGFLTLRIAAYDPFGYASMNEYDPKENYLYDRGYMYDIGLMYDNPKSFEWVYKKHYSGINNYSTLVADFVIEIQGTVTDPSVTNLNDGTKLTLPSISSGRLLINGNTYSVTRNGQDVLGGSNYNFFHIQPGEVGFLFEGEKPSATVTYKWVHKFM